jgi:hypothetical protein
VSADKKFTDEATDAAADAVARALQQVSGGTVFGSAVVILIGVTRGGDRTATASLEGCDCPFCMEAAIRAIVEAFGGEVQSITEEKMH